MLDHSINHNNVSHLWKLQKGSKFFLCFLFCLSLHCCLIVCMCCLTADVMGIVVHAFPARDVYMEGTMRHGRDYVIVDHRLPFHCGLPYFCPSFEPFFPVLDNPLICDLAAVNFQFFWLCGRILNLSRAVLLMKQCLPCLLLSLWELGS